MNTESQWPGFAGWYKLRASRFVTANWPLVIGAWLIVVVALRLVAPNWNSIAADGDLAFLPHSVPSAVGLKSLNRAFPGSQTQSRLVVVIATADIALKPGELAVAMDLARRLHWLAAKNAWQRLGTATQHQASDVTPMGIGEANAKAASQVHDSVLVDIVNDNLSQAIEIEESLLKYIGTAQPNKQIKRLPDAFAIRSLLLETTGDRDQAAVDASAAEYLAEQGELLPGEVPVWGSAIRDVWTWRSPVVGHKLGSEQPRARLINLQLATDFTATANIDIMVGVESLVRDLRAEYSELANEQLRIEVSGSAAVGADMLRAASSGVRKTEIVTILLVILILSAVYRAPLLVAIPLVSIAVSLTVATSIIALLARDPTDAESMGLGVFTTTRIFIVVLLFGAGTDFCLFLLARCRELLQTQQATSRSRLHRAVASGWRSVHDAILASGFTTIVGLTMMWFSRFEKFQFSGPIIAISLAVTLLVTLTLTPALLCALGHAAFWPQFRQSKVTSTNSQKTHNTSGLVSQPREPFFTGYWRRLADIIVSRPAIALTVTLAIIAVPAAYGMRNLNSVTYDLAEELSESAPSRQGALLISEFFSTSDGSPITLLVEKDEPFSDDDTMRRATEALAKLMYVEGVESVRCLTDPLGDYPPGKRMGLFAQDAWRRRLLLNHRITREHYVSSVGELSSKVARFDVLLSDNPFSLPASATLAELRSILNLETANSESPWFGGTLTTSGTTVGIADLRSVTQSDQRRIQILVTIGVWLVLLLLLRNLWLSSYLIFTVLLSYFATLGITYGTFSAIYGSEYSGIDWKVPIFLFVILVAVGQDYNVYLVTRIIEERRKNVTKEAVRRALIMTGGIITSCGMVMAGTFIAMTSPAVILWLGGIFAPNWIDTTSPVLRGITELGFALAFGVLLDTLVVRSILVPAFVVLSSKSESGNNARERVS